MRKIKINYNTESLVSRPTIDDYYRKEDADTRAVYCVVLFGIVMILSFASLIIDKFYSSQEIELTKQSVRSHNEAH